MIVVEIVLDDPNQEAEFRERVMTVLEENLGAGQPTWHMASRICEEV